MFRIQSSIIALALFGLTAYVGVLLFANMNAVVPKSSVKAWQQKKVLPEENIWQLNLDQIQTAIKLDSSNPDYLENEAQLYRYKANMPDTRPSEAIAAYREALSKYQHLLTLRPSWAPYWSSIISIKYDLWEYDEVMADAIQNTARLAPWFKASQHIILQAGFHGWTFIDTETSDVVEKTLRRAMLLQPKETIRLALEQGFGDKVESFVEGDDMLMGLYEQELQKMRQEAKKE